MLRKNTGLLLVVLIPGRPNPSCDCEISAASAQLFWLPTLMSCATFPTSDSEFRQEHSCLAAIICLPVVRRVELLSFILRAMGMSASLSSTLWTRPSTGVMNDWRGRTCRRRHLPSCQSNSEESIMHLQNLTLRGSEDFGRASSLVNASPAIKVTEWRRNTTHKLTAALQHKWDTLSFYCWNNFNCNFRLTKDVGFQLKHKWHFIFI